MRGGTYRCIRTDTLCTLPALFLAWMAERCVGDVGLVLGGDEDGGGPGGRVVLVVDGDRGLTVGAEVREDAGLAHLGEPVGEAVGEPDRHGHEVFGLVAGVAVHHPLVASTLAVEDVLAGHAGAGLEGGVDALRSEEHTSELQSLMRISYAVFCLKKKKHHN